MAVPNKSTDHIVAAVIDRQLPADSVLHLNVAMDAVALFFDKDELRGDMWRAFPPSDKIRELSERVLRIEAMYSKLLPSNSAEYRTRMKASIKEDALDLINYAVFLVRQLDEGMTG